MDIIQVIQEHIKNNSQAIIAIDGPSTAGKSTLAIQLQELFDCNLFHTDDYFLPSERKTKERLIEPGGNLDYERMLEEIFYNLNQEEIVSNHFDCTSNQLKQNNPVIKKQIIFVEGVYSLHPLFQKYYSLKIFLDIDQSTQLKRLHKRNKEPMITRWVQEWIPLENKYFNELSIRGSADYRTTL